jgi:hypothetical protein
MLKNSNKLKHSILTLTSTALMKKGWAAFDKCYVFVQSSSGMPGVKLHALCCGNIEAEELMWVNDCGGELLTRWLNAGGSMHTQFPSFIGLRRFP